MPWAAWKKNLTGFDTLIPKELAHRLNNKAEVITDRALGRFTKNV
jgi:hypothetical protein